MIELVDAVDRKACQELAKFFLPKKLPGYTAKCTKCPHVTDLVNMLRSSPNQLSTDIIIRKCLKLYEEEKGVLKQTLQDLDGKISLSVDILRSGEKDNCGSEYLCLTAYFIDAKWELKKKVLNLHLIGNHENGDDTPRMIIIKALKDWGIQGKIYSTTMLNQALYEDTMLGVWFNIWKNPYANNLYGFENTPLKGKLFGVRCCSDVIKLMVQDAYESVSETIERIGTVYNFKEGLPTWNNRSSQLREALILQSAGSLLSHKMPSKKNWNQLARVCHLVDDIYDIVYPLFETEILTSNIYLHHLQELQLHLMKKHNDSGGQMKDVIEKMLKRLDNYMKDMYLVLAIASVMDPRFKMKYIEFSCPKFKGDDSISKVSNYFRSIFEEYAAVHFSTEDGYLGKELLFEYTQFLKATEQPQKTELDLYLEEPLVMWRKNFNVLTWWKSASSRYPTLSRMARDLLAIPVTVAISDDAFYMKQRRADYSVISSGPELMNVFMCIKSWFLSS